MIDVTFLGTDVRPAGTAVIIDVLRASSTITLALSSGYERVLVAGSIEEAEQLRAPGRVLAGEVGCARAPGFDLGNSPEETLEPRAPELVLATTNGAPAIVASAAVVFAISADDFVISQWLSSGGPTDTVPIEIYAATRAAPLPSVNAIATIMMVSTLLIVTAGFLTWRFFTRGERQAGKVAEDFGGAFNIT